MSNVEKDPQSVAVQVLSCKDHSLILNLAEVKSILGSDEIKDRYVVVLSIAGCLRQGKSFLLNFFLKYLNVQYKKHDASDWIGEKTTNEELNGFKWRGGKHPETNGIWMWSEIFTHDFDDGQKIAIILLDTQGIFDHESSLKDCISIFGISMLLSSVQCYNVMRNVDENHLQNLQLFTEYAGLAMQATNEIPFQQLLFIVRDWPWPDENGFGYSEEYIEELLEETEKHTPEMRELRQQIKSSFNCINAFLMPNPGKFVAREKNFKGNLNQIDEDFVEKIKELVPSIFGPDRLVVKKLNGECIRACDFVVYLETYVNMFNGNELPKPQTVWQGTVSAQMYLLYEEGIKQYISSSEEFLVQAPKYFGFYDDFEGFNVDELNKIKKVILNKFEEKRKLADNEMILEWKKKLEIAIDYKREDFMYKIDKVFSEFETFFWGCLKNYTNKLQDEGALSKFHDHFILTYSFKMPEILEEIGKSSEETALKEHYQMAEIYAINEFDTFAPSDADKWMNVWFIALKEKGRSKFISSLEEKFNGSKKILENIETKYKQCLKMYFDKMKKRIPWFDNKDFEKKHDTAKHTERQTFVQWAKIYSHEGLTQTLTKTFELKLLHAIDLKFKYLKKLNEEKKQDAKEGAKCLLSIASGVAAFAIGGPLGIAARIGLGLFTTVGTNVVGNAIIGNENSSEKSIENSKNDKKKLK